MQNPALVEAPLSLQLAVNSPPKTSIKTSGATVVMTAIVKVMVLPPGQPPVQLSSMTMVYTHIHTSFFYFFRILLDFFDSNMCKVSGGLIYLLL